jgi:hypothetical protein
MFIWKAICPPVWECAECGEVSASKPERPVEGRLLCEHCFDEKYITCCSCQEDHLKDSATLDHEDDWWCERCADRYLYLCEHCEQWFEHDDVTQIGSDWWCEQCRDDHFTECESCSEWVDNDNVCCTDSGSYCQECYSESYGCCDECGRECSRDDLYYHEDDDCFYCSRCYEQHSSNIHEYGFKPRAAYRGRGPLHFGVELEVIAPNHDKQEDVDWISEQAGELFYCKEDGSLHDGAGGFEIVSHPFDWAAYQKEGGVKQTYNELLEYLQEHKYKSYNTTCCGIHVHMSMKAFSSWHLYKFMAFFYENGQFIHRISQRSTCPHNVAPDGDCNHRSSCNKNCMIRWAGCKKSKHTRISESRDKEAYADRYTACNITGRTIEIRIFRGTLSKDAFHKNLEFCHAVYTYTKNCSAQDVTVPKFVAWLSGKKEYGNLATFIDAKVGVLKCA